MKIDKVTITGADDTTDIQWMREITRDFPFVEWGILVSASSQGSNRFPSPEWMNRLAAHQDEMQTSIHVCGKWVRQICTGDWSEFIKENGHVAHSAQRVQLNFHAYSHVLDRKFFTSANRASSHHHWQLIFQVDGVNDHLVSNAYDEGINAVPLYDLSGGAGVVPGSWPEQMAGIYSGYAGGLGPENVMHEILKIRQVASGDIWIDMETRVRTADDKNLDCDAVESVLRQCATLDSLRTV